MRKIFAFVSSYTPLFVFFVLKGVFLDCPQKNNLGLIEIFIGTIFSLVGVAYILIIMIAPVSPKEFKKDKPEKDKPEKGETVSKTSNDTLINYLMAYVIPLFSGSVETSSFMFSINVVLLMIVGILYVRLDLVFLNPVLAIFGFIPRAEISTGKIYLTNLDPNELQAIMDSKKGIYGITIADNVIFAKRKANDF